MENGNDFELGKVYTLKRFTILKKGRVRLDTDTQVVIEAFLTVLHAEGVKAREHYRTQWKMTGLPGYKATMEYWENSMSWCRLAVSRLNSKLNKYEMNVLLDIITQQRAERGNSTAEPDVVAVGTVESGERSEPISLGAGPPGAVGEAGVEPARQQRVGRTRKASTASGGGGSTIGGKPRRKGTAA